MSLNRYRVLCLLVLELDVRVDWIRFLAEAAGGLVAAAPVEEAPTAEALAEEACFRALFGVPAEELAVDLILAGDEVASKAACSGRGRNWIMEVCF